MVKVASQQSLGKDEEKSTASRIYGMGLMMILPKYWYGKPTFLTQTGKESDTDGF